MSNKTSFDPLDLPGTLTSRLATEQIRQESHDACGIGEIGKTLLYMTIAMHLSISNPCLAPSLVPRRIL